MGKRGMDMGKLEETLGLRHAINLACSEQITRGIQNKQSF